jgi:hypothetical protein
MVCACRETACPMSGSSGARSRRIRNACRPARTTRDCCCSDDSAAVRYSDTRQGTRDITLRSQTAPQTLAMTWGNRHTAHRDMSPPFGYLFDIHGAFLCGRTKAERYGVNDCNLWEWQNMLDRPTIDRELTWPNPQHAITIKRNAKKSLANYTILLLTLSKWTNLGATC